MEVETQRRRARPVPGYRPCAACGRPMTINASYDFSTGEVRCICTNCYRLGCRFDAIGEVLREGEVNNGDDELAGGPI